MKLLFLSHVDQNWIKQRPHFLAEGLQAEGFDVTFAYAVAYRRSQLTRRALACRTRALVMVPQRLRGRLGRLDKAIQKFAGRMIALTRPSCVWLCHPRLGELALTILDHSDTILIYDCMDRAMMFEGSVTEDRLTEAEVVRRASLIFCSSSALEDDMQKAGAGVRALVVRNALADSSKWWIGPRRVDQTDEVILGYAGTISSWFDWATLLTALDAQPTWRLLLWGPVDSVMPSHPRVIHKGVVSHEALPEKLACCDVLVMPFTITPLIAAVDPVKAYEYVATGRGVVLPRYAETDYFCPFAQRYTAGDAVSFREAVTTAYSNRASEAEAVQFVSRNGWTVRVKRIAAALEDLR